MVTEPEAAAIYTARHLKEDKQREFLKVRLRHPFKCYLELPCGSTGLLYHAEKPIQDNTNVLEMELPGGTNRKRH